MISVRLHRLFGPLVLPLLTLAAAPAPAQVLAVEIGRVGVIEPTDPDPPTVPPSGDNLVGSSAQRPKRYLSAGGAIDAHYCTLFGFEFRAPNLPEPLTMPVTVQLDHPAWTRPDGRSGTRERYPNVLHQDWSYSGYHLEENWTLVPGIWTFTVLMGDTVLAAQSFDVKVAPNEKFPAGGCGAPLS